MRVPSAAVVNDIGYAIWKWDDASTDAQQIVHSTTTTTIIAYYNESTSTSPQNFDSMFSTCITAPASITSQNWEK